MAHARDPPKWAFRALEISQLLEDAGETRSNFRADQGGADAQVPAPPEREHRARFPRDVECVRILELLRIPIG